MKTKMARVFLLISIGALSLALPTAAFSGYYEPLSGDPPSASWYTFGCPATTNLNNCAYHPSAVGYATVGCTGGPACPTGTFSQFAITLPVQTGDWQLQFSWSIARTHDDNHSHGITMTLSGGAAGMSNSAYYSRSGGQALDGGGFSHYFTTGGDCYGSTTDVLGAGNEFANSGTVVFSFVRATNTLTESNGINTACSLVSTNYRTFTTIQLNYIGTPELYTQANGLDTWDAYSALVYNDNDGHTFSLSTSNTAPVFDTGIKSFATGMGFISAQSQTFFAMIIIALTEIFMAFVTGFFGEGKWRIWAIHGVASLMGCICSILGWIQFWEVLVGIILGTTVVSGGRDILNTVKKSGAQLVAARFGRGPVPSGAVDEDLQSEEYDDQMAVEEADDEEESGDSDEGT